LIAFMISCLMLRSANVTAIVFSSKLAVKRENQLARRLSVEGARRTQSLSWLPRRSVLFKAWTPALTYVNGNWVFVPSAVAEKV